MDDQLHDLIGAYAMDALDPDERAAFEQHLRDCADCRQELAALSETLAQLADDYAVEPPPALRDAVLSAVANLDSTGTAPATVEEDAAATSEPRRLIENDPTSESHDDPVDAPAPTQPRPRRAVAGTDPPASAADAGATVTPIRREASSGRSRWQVLVAAAVAVIAVIGIAVWQPWAPRTITAADVLAAPDAVRATQPAEGGGSVTLVRSNQLGRAVMVTQGLAAAPAGKAHQAWLQQPSGTMVSGGMMPDGPDVTMLLEGDARDTVGGGISVEPPGGSSHPSTDIVVLIGL